MNRIYPIILLLFAFTVSRAQTGNLEFIENKGQWDARVKYMGYVPAGSFFVRSSGFTVLQHNASDLAEIQEVVHGHTSGGNTSAARKQYLLRSHAYNVDFAGASPDFEIIPDKPLDTYNNYFIGSDPSRWASNCRIYQAVTLKNIYPNIDVRYYTDNGQMKYDIIAKPGSDISKIVMQYEGADKLEIKNRQLVVSTSVGDVKEMDPYTYQYENNTREQVTAKYIVKGNEVRFDIKNYNKNETLIIDPTLIFSSFSGSTTSNWGYTATYGPDGSMYAGGIVFAPGGFPVSIGSYQTTFGGGSGNEPVDIGIIKLSPNGANRVYATYIGGGGTEQPHSLIVDGAGNLVVAGRTNSANYPTTPANTTIGAGGLYDIVVTKLNAAGSALIGSKKIGGAADDGVNIPRGETEPTRCSKTMETMGEVKLYSMQQEIFTWLPAHNLIVLLSHSSFLQPRELSKQYRVQRQELIRMGLFSRWTPMFQLYRFQVFSGVIKMMPHMFFPLLPEEIFMLEEERPVQIFPETKPEQSGKPTRVELMDI
ncbi:MAG: hypothetical protein HC867_02330 [Bacteroidia bacterium]|nr:hypothetical protein [Bacteroidia bacterium]